MVNWPRFWMALSGMGLAGRMGKKGSVAPTNRRLTFEALERRQLLSRARGQHQRRVRHGARRDAFVAQ